MRMELYGCARDSSKRIVMLYLTVFLQRTVVSPHHVVPFCEIILSKFPVERYPRLLFTTKFSPILIGLN